MLCLQNRLLLIVAFLTMPALAQTLEAKGAVFPFAIVVHVATTDSSDTDARIDMLVSRANEHFAEADVTFRVVEQNKLPVSFARLDTIRERRRLKRFFVTRSINVFLVDEILDPHPSKATKRASAWQGRKPSGRLAGAHIKIKHHVPSTYIVLSRAISPVSLAHELGHFFGASHHRDPNNIMSYGSHRNHFNKRQLTIFRTRARLYRRKKTVRLLKPEYSI
ncbi:MAG: hypothetical protein GY847_23965 [Proteobacteria bacterium]|nr:hypothetical protein [Pseudomonadota bacterium]